MKFPLVFGKVIFPLEGYVATCHGANEDSSLFVWDMDCFVAFEISSKVESCQTIDLRALESSDMLEVCVNSKVAIAGEFRMAGITLNVTVLITMRSRFAYRCRVWWRQCVVRTTNLCEVDRDVLFACRLIRVLTARRIDILT